MGCHDYNFYHQVPVCNHVRGTRTPATATARGAGVSAVGHRSDRGTEPVYREGPDELGGAE